MLVVDVLSEEELEVTALTIPLFLVWSELGFEVVSLIHRFEEPHTFNERQQVDTHPRVSCAIDIQLHF